MSEKQCLVIRLPIHTRSEANLREHWRLRAKRTQNQRYAARALTWHAALNAQRPVGLPADITLTRIAPRRLDSDNLAGSLKAVRDGIADGLGIDDGHILMAWHYKQRKGGVGEYAVVVEVTWQGNGT